MNKIEKHSGDSPDDCQKCNHEKNKAAQELAFLRHKKNPPTKEFMREISKKGVEARLNNSRKKKKESKKEIV